MLTKIQKHWEDEKYNLQLEIDRMCIVRARQLVDTLKPFQITEILFGNGTFTFRGSDFPVVYDDESEGSLPIVELLYYGEQYRSFVWTPRDMTPFLLEALIELVQLCDWWVDATGGKDMTFVEEPNA
jgi:hypothetical protein